MLVLMIGEFALMFLVFDAILYHKKAGLMHSIVTRLRCKGKTIPCKRPIYLTRVFPFPDQGILSSSSALNQSWDTQQWICRGLKSLKHFRTVFLFIVGQTKDEVEKQSDIRNSYEVSSVSTKEDFVENV